MKKLLYLSLAAACLTVFASCSDDALDAVNADLNHPQTADAKFVFADLCLSSAFNVAGGDFNTYLGVAVEHWGGCHNQLYKADQRDGEWISSSCFDNAWTQTYKAISDARTIIAKCDPNSGTTDAGNTALASAAKVLLAYDSAVLTDLFGDTPYSQACDYDKYKTPDLDKQEDIYKTIFTLLDEAIAGLEDAGSIGTGSYDFIYGGKADKWLKFAYGLRARLTMHNILRAADKAAAYASILSDIENSFESAEDQASFTQYDGVNNLNPLFAFWIAREAIAASGSLYDKLAEREDPRLAMIYCYPWVGWFNPTNPEEEFDPVPNGEGFEAQEWYTDDVYLYAVDAPTHLLSYAELQYLKAEVLARTGIYTEARAALKEALAATFVNVNVNVKSSCNFTDTQGYGVYGPNYNGDYLTPADAEAYAARVFDTLDDAELLAEIMVQKYLFFHNANGGSVEAFNDVRRLKAEGGEAAEYIALANPNNATKFPLRCGYGSSDTTTNPNIKNAFGDGSYVYTENVWWAGGKR